MQSAPLLEFISGMKMKFPVLPVCAALSLIPASQGQEPRIYDLDPMTVTTTQARQDPFLYPEIEPSGLQVATSEITATDILRQNVTTLTEALEFAPGAWTASRGRKIKTFTSFRGQTYPFPDYAIDGMWFREFYELPYFFPASEIDRIEVVRSSAALATGLSSLSGVINIVPVMPLETKSRMRVEYGSLNHQYLHLSHAEVMRDSSIKVSLGHYAQDGEEGMNAAERVTTASLNYNWSSGDSLEVNGFLFFLKGSRELELALPPAGRGLQSRVEEFDPMQSVLGGMRIRSRNALGTTQVSVWGSDRKARFIEHSTGATHDDDDWESGIQVLQSMQPFEGNTLRAGALYHRWRAPDGKRFFAGRTGDIATYSIVVIDQHELGDLQIDTGYRWSREFLNEFGGFNIEGNGAGFQEVAPIIDQWAAPQHRFNLGGSYGIFRLASLFANYSFGQTGGPAGAINRDAVPVDDESRHMLDLGFQYTGTRMGTLKAGVFLVSRLDGIHIIAETYQNEIGLESPYYENRDSRQQGLEVEWKSPWYGNWISFFASGILMKSEFRTPGGSFTSDREIPGSLFTAGVYMHRDGFDASLFGSYTGGYENDRFSPSGPKPLGNYFNLNATAGYAFNSGSRIHLSLKNILDDRYSTVVGYYDEGFTVTGGLQYTF